MLVALAVLALGLLYGPRVRASIGDPETTLTIYIRTMTTAPTSWWCHEFDLDGSPVKVCIQASGMTPALSGS